MMVGQLSSVPLTPTTLAGSGVTQGNINMDNGAWSLDFNLPLFPTISLAEGERRGMATLGEAAWLPEASTEEEVDLASLRWIPFSLSSPTL